LISPVWDACHRDYLETKYPASMDAEPLVSVVHGVPTPEELAALVGALASLTGPADARSGRASTSAWVRSGRPASGPGSWRVSALPR
jgi:hypothetical protein